MEAQAALNPQQRAEEALRFFNEKDPNKAIETIQPLEETDPNYCHYFKARVDFRRNNNASALSHLVQITEAGSELLPNVRALAQKIIPRLIRQQMRRALKLFDEGKYGKSKQVINSVLNTKRESQFCDFMLGKIAQKENNLRLAVTHLAKVTSIRDDNSVVTHDLYAPAAKILAEILNEQAEIARAALNVRDFNTAKTVILIIQICNTESAFCNYIKAEIANREGKTSSALEYLGSAALENADNKKSLITFDTTTAVQNMLTGLVTGQLKEKSKCKAKFIPLDDPVAEIQTLSIDAEDDFRTENIDVFVKVTRLENFGVRFHFTKALSLESQLRVLENLKTLYAETKQGMPRHSHLNVTLFGEDIESEAQFLRYLTREQTLIKGHIAAEEGLWAQAYAYYYQALSFGVYKEELAHLRAFYFDKTDMLTDGDFTDKQRYKIIQSLFLMALIDTDTYVRWLGNLRCIILFPTSPADHPSQDEDDQSSRVTADSSAVGSERPLSNDNNQSSEENGSEAEAPAEPIAAEFPAPSEEARKLVDKIEEQILLFDSALKTESKIEEEKKMWLEGSKVTQTKTLIYGEDLNDYSKRFFESAWNLSRFKPLNAIAVLFAAFAFLPALARKKYQLTHRNKRKADEIARDDAALDERRTEMRDNYFKKVRRKESMAESKRHLLLAPKEPIEEIRAVSDQQLEEQRVREASHMQLAAPPRSPTKNSNNV